MGTGYVRLLKGFNPVSAVISGGGSHLMPRMLGDRLLPESVQARRRSVRNRVRDLREPVRSFREQNVPGPDVVGTAESKLSSLRDRFVSRDAVVERIREMRADDSVDSGGSMEENSGSSNTTSTL